MSYFTNFLEGKMHGGGQDLEEHTRYRGALERYWSSLHNRNKNWWGAYYCNLFPKDALTPKEAMFLDCYQSWPVRDEDEKTPGDGQDLERFARYDREMAKYWGTLRHKNKNWWGKYYGSLFSQETLTTEERYYLEHYQSWPVRNTED